MGALPAPNDKQGRIGIFNVVKFPNDVCKGSGSMNGTCYTKEECSNRAGTASGSCAEGFGTCCFLFLLEVHQVKTTHICTSVSRIRLDFTKFVLAAPGAVVLSSLKTLTTSIGACLTDTFTVSGSGKAAPVICGTNTGHHMIVDSNGVDCISANFVFGGETATREYHILVTQYDKSNAMGGPPGCLQYYTGSTGTIATFNWVDRTSVHLQNQDYNICFRQNAGICGICFSETATSWSKTTGTFGVAITSIAGTTNALVGTSCITDYVVIPNSITTLTASTAAATLKSTTVTVSATDGKHCGRILGAAAGTASKTVCTNTTPFTLGVL